MPIQAVENQRLYRQIADQLAGLINTGEYKVGDRLPPERVLAEQLRVSRSSVREALIALEVEGSIEIRGGTGVFVIERKTSIATPNPEEAPGPFEILDARLLLEPEAAALAARQATAADRESLTGTLEGMGRPDAEMQEELAGDRAFHLEIARIAGNSALSLLIQTLWDIRQGSLYLRLEQHFQSTQMWELASGEHHAVMDAIATGDARAARAAMARHIRNTKTRFTAAWSIAQGGPAL